MKPESISYKKILLVYHIGWLIWCVIHAGILYRLGFSWTVSVIDSLVSNVLMTLVISAMMITLRFYQPGKNTSTTLFIWCLVLSGVLAWCSKELLAFIIPDNQAYQDILQQSLPIRYSISFLMIGWIVLLSWIWNSILSQKETESRKSDTESLAREAELTSLRQQLQPHFLFNSLNSISALVVSKPDEARRMIQQLSDFLRGTLKKDEEKMVSLREELDHLKLYLEIEKVRFGHRLNVTIENEEEHKHFLLPPLLLQPIVENAIKFGLYDTIDTVTIRIFIKAENTNLIVGIENPFDPSTSQPRTGAGFGLSSIQRKLWLLFSRTDLLETKSNGTVFTTTVIIPQTT